MKKEIYNLIIPLGNFGKKQIQIYEKAERKLHDKSIFDNEGTSIYDNTNWKSVKILDEVELKNIELILKENEVFMIYIIVDYNEGDFSQIIDIIEQHWKDITILEIAKNKTNKTRKNIIEIGVFNDRNVQSILTILLCNHLLCFDSLDFKCLFFDAKKIEIYSIKVTKENYKEKISLLNIKNRKNILIGILIAENYDLHDINEIVSYVQSLDNNCNNLCFVDNSVNKKLKEIELTFLISN